VDQAGEVLFFCAGVRSGRRSGVRVCVAEEAIPGRQLTVEGYRHRGQVVIYGVIDSVCYENSPSFQRYQYPSALGADVRRRLVDISIRVVQAIGMEGMTFNIEYFYDPATARSACWRSTPGTPRRTRSCSPMSTG